MTFLFFLRNVTYLNFSNTIDIHELATGDYITVEGKALLGLKTNQIKVESFYINKKQFSPPTFISQKKAITYILSFSDLKATVTVADIDADLYTSPTSTYNYFRRSSNDQLLIQREVTPTIYNVNLNYPAGDTCDYEKWGVDAMKTLASQGVEVSAYQHHIFILPLKNTCPWFGIGQFDCGSNCKIWTKAGAGPASRGIAHELGHNFGLHHSSTDLLNNGKNIGEYDDLACFMGHGARELNAPQRDRLHAFDDKPLRITTVTTNKQFLIKAIDRAVNELQVLKVIRKDGLGTYYISYRNKGPFGMIDPYLNKVNVHKINNNDLHTFYITSLDVNQSFVDQSNQINIKVIEKGWDYAKVEVSFNS